MARRRKYPPLEVRMNGEAVGQLERASGGNLRFSYATNWLQAPGALPLSVRFPLAKAPYSGDELDYWFGNLLPDRPESRQRMARTTGAASDSTYDLLSAAGRDCIGALQLLEPGAAGDVRRIEGWPLDEALVARHLRSVRTQPPGVQPGAAEFRISLAGAQDKTALLLHEDRWQIPLGATPSTHLLKLPIGRLPNGYDLSSSVANEWLCLQIARELGLRTPDTWIARFEDQEVLVVERFDRRLATDGTWIVRSHQEDLCQAHGIGPTHKYEADGGPGMLACLELLSRSMEAQRDRLDFLRAQILYHWLAATDGHAKNFSIHIHPGGGFESTPLYDIMSLWPLLKQKQVHRNEVRMAMGWRACTHPYTWTEIRAEHYLETGRRAGLPTAAVTGLVEALREAVPQAIQRTEARLPSDFPEQVAAAIFEGLRRMAGQT